MSAKEKLWTVLKPLGFDRQVPVIGFTKNGGTWSYILDFAWPKDKPRLAIECDGPIHNKQKGRDRRRDTRLAAEHIVTVRVRNCTVLKDMNNLKIRLINWMVLYG